MYLSIVFSSIVSLRSTEPNSQTGRNYAHKWFFDYRNHRPTFPKSESIRNRLYDNSSLAKPTLRLKIPTSPESDGEIYSTPNTTANLNDTNGTPFHQTPPNFKITKIQSMGSIPSTSKRRFEEMLDEQAEEAKCDTVHEPSKALPETPANGALYRMKSLGNLTQYESSFGDTPKELIMLKEEFERRRAGLVRRRSLTNLLADAEADVTDSVSPVVSPRKDSIFASKASLGHNKYKKKFGVGDTKYIGQDDSIDSNNILYHLTKIKSVGTIPDIVGERVNFEPFLTPITVRRHPVSLHEFRGGGVEGTSSSSDGDDESAFLEQRNTAGGANTSLRFINEVSLLRAPFERGFRRSYVKENKIQAQTANLRQSDGYFKAPLLPGMYNQQRPKSAGMASAAAAATHTMDKAHLTSLHNVSAKATGGSGGLNGKTDSIR